ncbi:MAG: RNA 2',3'-cyclic phosphodiesterase [Pirellulaceae bacterium]|nr:RNA 2',3'-cyclic phosphodiesterase [Pirellulaceae bacterium]
MQTTRTFIAVEIGSPAREVILRLIKQLAGELHGVRWTQPDQLHLTLKFIGDIDNRELPEICSQMRAACSGIEAFSASLKGVGAFPKNKPPRVLWVGFQDGAEPLKLINQRLETSLTGLGIPTEGRAYVPHLTLGRINRGADQEQIAARLAHDVDTEFASFDISDVHLIASIRERNRMIYETIDTVPLD